jgi:hypothetical protein
VNKQIVFALVLAVLLAVSAHAQTTDIFTLVLVGTPQDVQAAIDGGADVNAYRGIMTPLTTAAGYSKNPEVITTLLKAGAKLEARDTEHGRRRTALIWAAFTNSNPEMTSTLLKAGADINALSEDGRTALIWAALNNPNPEEVLRVLLNAGADATVRDKAGKTAYDYMRYDYRLKATAVLKQLKEASK